MDGGPWSWDRALGERSAGTVPAPTGSGFLFGAASAVTTGNYADLAENVYKIEVTYPDPIPYYEEAKHYLRLKRDSTVLLTNLPGPSIQYYNADIILYV